LVALGDDREPAPLEAILPDLAGQPAVGDTITVVSPAADELHVPGIHFGLVTEVFPPQNSPWNMILVEGGEAAIPLDAPGEWTIRFLFLTENFGGVGEEAAVFFQEARLEVTG
jgi:hypothetical protein